VRRSSCVGIPFDCFALEPAVSIAYARIGKLLLKTSQLIETNPLRQRRIEGGIISSVEKPGGRE